MLIKTLPVGDLETNCYIVTNEATLHSVVIDPGDESNTIMDYLEENHLICDAIFLTHGHFDHVGAVSAYYQDGDQITEAGLVFHVMETPGHTPGSVCLRVEDALFTGDTLFRGSCGRTDLDGGDMDAMMHSLKKICRLEGDYEVYPGHMEATSLLRERLFNYYCRRAMEN